MKTNYLFKVAAFLLVFTAVLSSCKKYEEGPAFSLASKKGRVVGKWEVESVIVNGTKVEDYGDAEEKYYIELTKDNKVFEHHGSEKEETGVWAFDDKKEHIIITETDEDHIHIDKYEIIRLKSKELWLREKDEDGDVLEIRLKAA